MTTYSPEAFAPAAIDAEIRSCIKRIEQGVIVVSKAEAAASAARREFDRAFAQATVDAAMNPELGRNAETRKAYAVLNTMSARENAEIKEEAKRFAERQARALVEEMSGLRSLLVSARALYSEVGRGEP